jgi:serine/threonine protein kinase/Tol biopolymer transport system component
MGLSTGARLGPYEILAPLGAGGMGEVYRAKDARLNRTVAIKVLSDKSAADADRRERFEREAKAISSLEHPNICALYDVGNHEGTYFLVMPCLEGQTLAERLRKGPLPPDQAIKHAIEIATALDAAHRHGIVHRDLKPGTIMLTKTGVKLLDFGLAKLKKATGLLGDTTIAKDTGIGTLLGTMPYMSPEQIEGRDVDARSDLFSLGAVIYEMVTGQRAFKGETAASVIGSILKDEPTPMKTLQPLTPAALDHVAGTCLAKDPDERWQSAADVARELKWIAQGGSDITARPPNTRSKRWIWLAAVAATALAGFAVAAWPALNRLNPAAPDTIRFAVQAPPGLDFFGSNASLSMLQFAVSPNGRYVAFVAARPGSEPSLLLRALNDVASRELAGSAGATEPFWSPDSAMVGFFSRGRIKTLHIGTGEVRDICAASRSTPRGGAWNRDGIIVFGGDFGAGLFKVSVSTGVVEEVVRATGSINSLRWPQFLPDGRRFLFYARGQASDRGIYVGALDGTPPVRIMASVFNAQYALGFLLTVRDGALLAYPFDERVAAVSGDPIQVADRIGGSSNQHAAFSASANGVLVISGGASQVSHLTWFDRNGRETDPQLEPGNIPTFDLAPDGRQVAMARMDPNTNTADIWITDLERATSARFTLDPANDLAPTWSRDGKQILFRSDRTGDNLLYRKASVGGSTDEQLGSNNNASNPTDWSADGRYALFHQTNARTNSDLGYSS